MAKSKTIVLIHGNFVNNSNWTEWKRHYEQKVYTVQTLKVALPAFGFFSFNKYFMGSRKWYDYAFFNTMPDAEKEKAFEKFAVPESYKVSRQLVLNSFSNIDFKKPHAPILFVGGGSDNIFPPSLTQEIAGRYKDANSRVDLKIFAGKSHFICGE